MLSIVSPVYNEEPCLSEFLRRVELAAADLGVTHEIILIDDGSVDRSWSIIEEALRNNRALRAIRFSRNFGHHVALSAGLDYASGEWVVVMDSDLQDNPDEIAVLYGKAREGFDVVLGRRERRRHGVLKQLLARLFYRGLNYLSDGTFDPRVGVFRIMSRQVVGEVCRLREVSRFFSGLVAWVGFRQTSVDVQHGSRYAGDTKYPLRRQISLAVDALLAFSEKPLKLAIYVGTSFASAGILYAIAIVVRALLGQIAVLGYASLMAAILIVGGVSTITIGLVGVYVGRVFKQVKARPLYVVSERINFAGDHPSAWADPLSSWPISAPAGTDQGEKHEG
ncbi:glycosyltransferase family 2 protein [Candidatus Accumulibacter aalborgensis]|uniref:glycosyltransferase family 2 protein n=1 Tax=Candidatus Accumulibacter aalborgensis TaxID=1860102 RepID=UPI0016478382|nr:glycosyltransferase family 2 protein [Candidatus Accumulibacter aalborgensis]